MKHIIGIALVALMGCGGSGQDGGTDASDVFEQDNVKDMGQDVSDDTGIDVPPTEDLVLDTQEITTDSGDESPSDTQENPQAVICEGDYLITNEAEADAIVDCTEITGRLTVNAGWTGTFSLPNLMSIGWDLEVSFPEWNYISQLESVEFPALSIVGGDVELVGNWWSNPNPNLYVASFPSLQVVEGRLVVDGNPILTTIEFPLLKAVSWSVVFTDNEGLSSVSIPNIETVGQDLEVFGNPGLNTFSVPSLKHVDGVLKIAVNFNLIDFSFPVLEFPPTALYIVANTALEDFSFPVLSSVVGDIDIHSNSVLTTFDFPMLESVQELLIYLNDSLSMFSFPALAEVEADFRVYDNIDLAQCLVDTLVTQVQSSDGIDGDIDTHDNNEACTCEEVGGETVATCPPEAP